MRDRLREKVEKEFRSIEEAFDAGLASQDERVRVFTATRNLAGPVLQRARCGGLVAPGTDPCLNT